MLSPGPARKATIFLNEDTARHGVALHDAILTFLMSKGIAGATATRAYAGFGSGHQLRSTRLEATSQHLPIRIEVQDTTVVKMARHHAPSDPATPHERRAGHAKLLRVFLGEDDRWHDEPLYDAIVKKLRMLEIAGATVYRGILGYGAKGHQHKASFFHPMRDLPIVISVIDDEKKITAAAAAIEAMLEDGLIVISDAEMVRLVRARDIVEGTHAPGIPS
jgi:PII-like signaling protein